MIVYGFEFNYFELIALVLMFLMFLYQLYFYSRYIFAVLRLRKHIIKNKVAFVDVQVPVSIIICAKDEVDNLRKYLPLILAQDYPDFEVIVVNDGSTDESEIFLNDLKKSHHNLRTTFVPVGTTNLSTKKLAITLGVKAAKNDWLLFTDADCMPDDKTWIARMARNFVPGIEFVLGYGAYFNKKSFVNKLITYDTLYNALLFLGFALNGKPYMGVGRNMAYRKEVFYRQKGFANTLHLRSGDDDLMVNSAANQFNTRIEIAPESITWSEPNRSFSDWYYQKERHLSVSTFYSTTSKMRLLFEPLSRGLFYLSFIFSLIFGNIITISSAVLLFIIRLSHQLFIINKSSQYWNERKYYFTVLVFDIFLPVVNLFIMTFGRMGSRAKNIYWK